MQINLHICSADNLYRQIRKKALLVVLYLIIRRYPRLKDFSAFWMGQVYTASNLEVGRFLKIRNPELRFLLPVLEMQNRKTIPFWYLLWFLRFWFQFLFLQNVPKMAKESESRFFRNRNRPTSSPILALFMIEIMKGSVAVAGGFLPSAEPKVYESLFFVFLFFFGVTLCGNWHLSNIDSSGPWISWMFGFHGFLDFVDFWTRSFGLGVLG